MILPPIAPIAYAFALGAVIGITGGWKVSQWKNDAAKLESERAAAQQVREEIDRGNRITAGWAAAADILRKQQRDRVVTVYREIEKPVYRDCNLPDSGGLLLDAAIDEANAARRAGSTVP